MINTVYLIPLISMAIIYLKLVSHVHGMSQRVVTANVLFHAQRELAMVRRIIIMVSILIALGFPYLIFVLISFFTSIYKYYLRIAFASIAVSTALVIIPLFQFTEPLKMAVFKRFHRQVNVPIFRTS